MGVFLVFVAVIFYCLVLLFGGSAENVRRSASKRSELIGKRLRELYTDEEMEREIVKRIKRDSAEKGRIRDAYAKLFNGAAEGIAVTEGHMYLGKDENAIAVDSFWMPIYLYALAEQGKIPVMMVTQGCVSINGDGVFKKEHDMSAWDMRQFERNVFMPWYKQFLLEHGASPEYLTMTYRGGKIGLKCLMYEEDGDSTY